jgi:hypothetical protein
MGKDLRLSSGTYDDQSNEAAIAEAAEQEDVEVYQWKMTLEDTRDYLKMLIGGFKMQAFVAVLVMVDVSMMFASNPFDAKTDVPDWQHNLTWLILTLFCVEATRTSNCLGSSHRRNAFP